MRTTAVAVPVQAGSKRRCTRSRDRRSPVCIDPPHSGSSGRGPKRSRHVRSAGKLRKRGRRRPEVIAATCSWNGNGGLQVTATFVPLYAAESIVRRNSLESDAGNRYSFLRKTDNGHLSVSHRPTAGDFHLADKFLFPQFGPKILGAIWG